MEEILSYIFIAAAIVISWLILHYWYKIQSREYIQSFIDSEETITILSTEEKVTMINREGLRILGFNSIKSFNASQVNLVNFFAEVDGCDSCFDKYTFGKKWIRSLYEKKKKNGKLVNKVKIFSKADTLDYYFQIKVSKLKGTNEYILNFTDISDIERNSRSLQKSAEIDPLTKVYNRLRMNKLFESMLFNANKYNKMLSIILFDIDHFKKINDQYGHNIGDSVLVELATLVKGMLREQDVMARWGGEEFIIVLSDTSAEDAAKLAERIRSEISNYYFEEVKRVTCSFGVTQFGNGDTRILFLERADEALYEAKENGRNRVIMRKKPPKD